MEPQYKSSAVNTPYDDVFRTMLNDCSSLIIPVINEVFSEQYTGEEEVILSLRHIISTSRMGRKSRG